MKTPLWKDRELHYPTTDLPVAEHFDVVIVGAGFTGLTAGVLLTQESKKVAIVEARDIGAGASGATTAKATLLQGNRLSEIARTANKDLAQSYLQAHAWGLGWLKDFCIDNKVPFDYTSAFTYARTPDGISQVEKEHELANELGLNTLLHEMIAAPFPVYQALELENQVELNPVDLLLALSEAFVNAGGTLVDQTRVVDVESDEKFPGIKVETAQGIITADQVLLATATPILDTGKTTIQLAPQRSYLCSFNYDGPVPDGMLISIESPTRSIRTASINGERKLLVGGNGHRTGISESSLSQIEEIVEWTETTFPGATLTHSWSAQDYHPVGLIPLITTLPWGDNKVHFAGGYSKWGMTGAPAAAQEAIALMYDRIPTISFGDASLWIKTKGALNTQSDMPRPTIEATIDAEAHKFPSAPDATNQSDSQHDGPRVQIGREDGKPVGEVNIDGKSCKVSLICPHMGAVLAWNDSEASWDCPLHGSRFDSCGELFEGPSTVDLPRP